MLRRCSVSEEDYLSGEPMPGKIWWDAISLSEEMQLARTTFRLDARS